MKIVPAILAEKTEDFLLRIKQAESFAKYVQIDIMDGVFVPARSFDPEEINRLDTALLFELHLMVEDPSTLMEKITNAGIKKVIFHVEAGADHLGLINRLKGRGLSSGLAVNPETEIDKFSNIVEHVDSLQFMTVDPCCYGHPFKPEVMDKISKARRLFPKTTISVDGGVSLDNLKSFVDAGVDYACVGSRIFINGIPEENYRLFLKRLEELRDKNEMP